MRSVTPLLVLAALAGCASPADDGVSPRNVVHSVQEGSDNRFEPARLAIRAGETVLWDVVGDGHHTIDFLDPLHAAGETLRSGDVGPGQTFRATFQEEGTYRYYCKYHSDKTAGMVGTIVVS